MTRSILAFTAALALAAGSSRSAEIPSGAAKVLESYCLDCHDADTRKGDINLNHRSVDWSSAKSRNLWEKVLRVTEDGLMPPAGKRQPATGDRRVLAKWLDRELLAHTPIGGTLPRRLNQAEYQATIRRLFALNDFTLPLGFPRDTIYHGFDNIGAGLKLSPPLLEAYSRVAGQIADQLFPPRKSAPVSTIRTAGPRDMVISFSASSVRGAALRLASRSMSVMRSCTWPSRVEIKDSGTYRITVDASTFRPKTNEPMKLEVRARQVTASERSGIAAFRPLTIIDVATESPKSATFEADLFAGETVVFRWMNAEMDHNYQALARQMEAWFKRDRRFLAAWQKAVYPDGPKGKHVANTLRGRNGWDIVTRHLADPNLDLSQATMDSPLTRKLMNVIESPNGTFNIADALCHHYFENGPSLEFHALRIEGPLKLVDGPKDIRRKKLVARLLGPRSPGQTDAQFTRAFLTRFLPLAFRAPVDSQTIDTFQTIADRHRSAGHSFDESIHLLIRNILISPRFLYRALGPGKLDNHALATRLSYFLTLRPADSKLIALADAGQLTHPKILHREALRLMPKSPNSPMIQSFTSQWLDTRKLPEIMPDPKFNFGPDELQLARREVEYFFAEMLKKNLPMTDFIDPDFTYTSRTFARENYQFGPGGKNVRRRGARNYKKADLAIERLPMKRGGRYNGLLGQSAIMIATANGVDTQPVLRGVWVLENILGTPPPAPPQNVPALTPDIRGATTPRELLAAHTRDASCALCHQRIDPVGFVLENYDPVGNWRDKWPKSNKPIDTAAILPDGTAINDVREFKEWLVRNIDQFSTCLAEKLMTYATGRLPNHAERKEIADIVKANHQSGNNFQDLLLALIASETFQTN